MHISYKQVYKIQLQSERWLETKLRIINRAGGVCEYCGIHSSFLQVHHEQYVGDHPSDTPDDNLKAICSECHDMESWSERLSKYSNHKRRLIESGIELTEEIESELIRKYEV